MTGWAVKRNSPMDVGASAGGSLHWKPWWLRHLPSDVAGHVGSLASAGANLHGTRGALLRK